MNSKEKKQSLFSLIIPCYNSEEYLERCLNSVLEQTYTNIEVILIDDGSTDKTYEIMKQFEKKALKKEIKTIIKKQENKGLGGAVNTGLKLVNGKYFSWYNSDDYLGKTCIEDFVKMFENNEKCNIIRCNGYMVPEEYVQSFDESKGKMISDWNTNIYDKELFLNMLLEINYNSCMSAIRTRSFDTIVENRNIYESREGQNYQILLPMFYNFESYYINKPNCYFVERKSSLSRIYEISNPSGLYSMYDEHKKIILETLKKMNIENFDYYKKLINQKYIIKKLEYSKKNNNQNDIDYYERQYVENVMNDNIYDIEVKKIKSKLPLVSIIIPVYNGSNYMREAIESAINQDYKNIEILVINDGSTDGGETEKIAKSYGNKIRYLSKKNGGVSTALNLGIKEMNGDFFSWLSHDDRYYSNKISTQINYLINNNLLNKNVITYTNYDVINEDSEVTGETRFEFYTSNEKNEIALLRGLVSGTALLIPKAAFEECGMFDEKYRCIQDYLLFFEFMRKYTYIHIPLITNSTRIHSEQVTNVSPKVIEENNFLWIYMQEQLSDETKIKIDGSIYEFYIEMERYLNVNMGNTKNDVKEARKYSLDKAQEYLEKGQTMLNAIIKKMDDEELLQILLTKYYENDNYPKISIECLKNSDKKNCDEINKIISTMGLYNVLQVVLNRTNNNKILYYEMLRNIHFIKPYYPNIKVKLSIKVKYAKMIGLKNTIRAIKQKIISMLRKNRITHFICKIVRLLLKIVCFIPKKIIQFILYV